MGDVAVKARLLRELFFRGLGMASEYRVLNYLDERGIIVPIHARKGTTLR
jgi:Fe2+ or Zn2+ uptake regulation protein